MVLQEVLNLSIEELRKIAPKSAVWAAGATRRRSVMQGVTIGAEYYKSAFIDQLNGAKLFFDTGVDTLFMPVLVPTQVREVGEYREKLFDILSFICREETLSLYKEMNVRVKFYGAHNIPRDGFLEMCNTIEEETKHLGSKTIWWSMMMEENISELDAVRSVIKSGVQADDLTSEVAIKALYGEQVSPVDILVGFGKFQSGYLMPPFLSQNTALYWMDYPSYDLDEETLRRIYWDYKYGRSTWKADKTNRYDNIDKDILATRHNQKLVWGVGERVCGFWYQALPDSEVR